MNTKFLHPGSLSLAFLLLPQRLPAATVTVCDETSLRTAITNGGTINFGCDGTIVLSSTLQITTNTVLDGTGHHVVLSGGDAVRVLFVATNIDFAMTNLVIANGKQQGTNIAGSGSGEPAFGAGIFNSSGHLILIGCVLSNNTTLGGNGLSRGQNVSASGGNSRGAAIYNDRGSIWMSNCVIAMNLCQSGAGKEVDESVGGIASGGGIYSTGGPVSIYDTTFERNTALGGTGTDNNVPYWLPGSGAGGALFVEGGNVALVHARFSNNQSSGGGVPVFQWTTSGSGLGGALYLTNCSASVSLCHFLTNNATSGSVGRYGAVGQARGGAIFNAANLMLNDGFFADNRSTGGRGNAQNQMDGGGRAEGGAVWNLASISVRRTTWIENEANGGSGWGVFSVSAPGGGGRGGAVYNGGVLTVSDSTIASNQAVGGDGQIAPVPNDNASLDYGGNGEGGGIFNEGQFSGTNITIVSNRAQGGRVDIANPNFGGRGGDGNGGGIYNKATLTLVHATLASNAALIAGPTNKSGIERGGGIFTTNISPVLQNSIIANSLAGNNSFGVLTDDGNNISSDPSCQFTAPGSLDNTDPLLSSLDDFGGPTPTMALLAGSPAIDHGLASYCPTTDQRGIARPFGGGCDIGAFESAPPYSVHGLVIGSAAVGTVLLSSGAITNVVSIPGPYALTGMSAGTFTITPNASNAVAIPNSRTVTVGPDVIGINFKLYQLNALTTENYTNQILHLVFAGTNGQTYQVQTTTSLTHWTNAETNQIGTEGISDFFYTNSLAEPGRFFQVYEP